MKGFVVLVGLIALLVFVISGRDVDDTSDPDPRSDNISDAEPISQVPSVAEPVNELPEYSVISYEGSPTGRGILEVRLTETIQREDIRGIAGELRQEYTSNDPLFINYYLPQMQIGWGAWATSHFSPDLEIQVLGVEDTSRSVSGTGNQSPEREVIGEWVDHRPGLGRIVIYEEDGNVLVEENFADGGQLVSEVTSVHHSAGRILTPIEPLVAEDQFRWIIRADGGLELRYLNGLITTLTPAE